VYFVLGGRINGGRIAGAPAAVERDTLCQDRADPVLNDGRRMLAGLFASLWDPGPQQPDAIFPRVPRGLKLV